MLHQSFSFAECEVAEQVIADPMNAANDFEIQADPYLCLAATFLLQGATTDAAMAMLGRAVLRQYRRDVEPIVAGTQRALDELDREAAVHARSDYRDLVTERGPV